MTLTRAAVAGLFLAAASPGQTAISFPTSDGATIHADLYGDGPRAVVLAHGGRFNKESWRKQAQALAAAGFKVLALDFRGYGKSIGPGYKQPMGAPLHFDVLGAVRYLRTSGATSVSAVGGSLGGGAVGEATVAEPGAIDRSVMLGATPAHIRGRSLFIMARDDTSGSGPRLPGFLDAYAAAPGPKDIIILDGSAHAQFLFDTEHAERVIRDILAFLLAP